MSESICGCDGSGTIVVPIAPTKTVTGGYSIESGGYMTNLCRCRMRLPRRHGKASWWTYDNPVSWTFGDENRWWLKATVTSKQELPVSADGYPLHRTLDNAHFCTGASIEIDGDALTSDDLRDLAKFLTECADKIDAMDQPVPDAEVTDAH